MATIVQNYGPIYGEVVNGTVQGRPNGSVYVPITNTISLSLKTSGTPNLLRHTNALDLSIAYTAVAISQDLASAIRLSVYSDAGCTTQFGTSAIMTAGKFNIVNWNWVGGTTTNPTVGASYYVRAELWNNGSMVAASTPIEAIGA